MIRLFLWMVMASCTLPGIAQVIPGTVSDRDNGTLLPAVIVYNKASGELVMTNDSGRFMIRTGIGDTVCFSRIGYSSSFLVLDTDSGFAAPLEVALRRDNLYLETVEVNPGYTPYQLDSLERRQLFGNQVDKKRERFTVSKHPDPPPGGGAPAGLIVKAPVTSVFHKYSPQYKRLWAFQKRFKAEEEQIFIDTRYTPELIETLTELKGDEIHYFKNSNPMPYDMARYSNDTEIAIWIKEQFKKWEQRKHPETK